MPVNLKVEGDIDATAVGKDVAGRRSPRLSRAPGTSLRFRQDVLDEEKKIMMVQMETSRSAEKIVMGKMKFYSENCLSAGVLRGDVFTAALSSSIA